MGFGGGTWGQIGSGLAKGVGAYNQAVGQREMYSRQSQAYDYDAAIAREQASIAIQNGQAEEERSRLQTAGVMGRQRAAMGAAGTDLGYGSNNDVLSTTKLLGERDAITIHDNALRTAWGYNVEATNFDNQSAFAKANARSINPWLSAGTSLLGSAKQSGFDFGSLFAPSVGNGSNPNGFNGTMNNPSAYVGGT